MMIFKGGNTQLSLFQSWFTAKDKKQPTDELPILYPNIISYSSVGVIKTCAFRYWLLYPGNWRGWETDAPPLVQEAYWLKRLSNWQGWAGNLVHEFVADVLFNQIDRAFPLKTGLIPKSDAELLNAVQQRFEGEWHQSKHWKPEVFRKIPRRDKPVWLLHHAIRDKSWNEVKDSRLKRKAWDWVERSINNVINQPEKFYGSDITHSGLIVEGLKLNEGLIVNDPGSVSKSQAQLRREKTYPRYQLAVNGEIWNYLFAIDYMAFTPQGKYLIVDFKTGREKSSHKEQLLRYAAFILQSPQQFEHLGLPEVRTNNLILRVVYTDPAVRQPIRDEHLRFTSPGRLFKKAKQDVLFLRDFLLRLDELEREQREVLQGMLPPRLFAGSRGLFKRDGQTLHRQTDPGCLVALPVDFPPTAAQNGKKRFCEFCGGLSICQEGKDLLAIANKL